jgi:hypothetical protein
LGRHLGGDTSTVTRQTRQGSGYDWDDARKAALFADIVSLKLSIDEAAALHGLRLDVIQEWLRQFRRSALVAFDERLKKTLIDQGANADALTAAEFTGHVEDVSIADLVQTIEIAGKDAVITVSHEGTESRMWCSAGAIIDAESGRLSGEAAVYRILAFERGRMVADLRPEQRSRTIYAATHRLLIEALRRKDEALALEKRLGNVNRFYRLGERSTSSRVRVSTDELSILRLFDGSRRLRDVLAQSHLGDLETLTALVRLVDDGYLVETETPPVPARPNVPPRPNAPPRPIESATRPALKTERLDSADHVDSRRAERPSATELPSLSERTRPDATTRKTLPRAVEERTTSGTGADGRETERLGSSDRADNLDTASTATSFVPMSVSGHREHTATPRWVFAAMAAAVLAPAAFWFGETMSNLRAARRSPAAARAESPRTEQAALEPAASFSLSTRVEPASAVFWLDRHPVASGRLDIVLPKDGRTHELRVAATGFIPVTLLFADVPPPRQIQLERLPAPSEPPLEPTPAPETAAPEQPPTPSVEAKLGPRGAAAVSAKTRALDPASVVGAETMPAAAPRIIELMPRDEPRVEIIEADAPRVRVIE